MNGGRWKAGHCRCSHICSESHGRGKWISSFIRRTTRRNCRGRCMRFGSGQIRLHRRCRRAWRRDSIGRGWILIESIQGTWCREDAAQRDEVATRWMILHELQPSRRDEGVSAIPPGTTGRVAQIRNVPISRNSFTKRYTFCPKNERKQGCFHSN